MAVSENNVLGKIDVTFLFVQYIYVAKTKALISCAVVCAYEKGKFSQDAASMSAKWDASLLSFLRAVILVLIASVPGQGL